MTRPTNESDKAARSLRRLRLTSMPDSTKWHLISLSRYNNRRNGGAARWNWNGLDRWWTRSAHRWSSAADLNKARTEDHEAERDATYTAQPLTQQGVDDAVAAGLRDRLAALDRALQRVEDGSYGRSIRSGAPIPDERLEGRSGGRAHRPGGRRRSSGGPIGRRRNLPPHPEPFGELRAALVEGRPSTGSDRI